MYYIDLSSDTIRATSWVTESVKYTDTPEKIMLKFSRFSVPQWTSPVSKDDFVSKENCDLEVEKTHYNSKEQLVTLVKAL